MRLSEAIRLGAMATTQGYGPLSITNEDAPCAIGAALLAVGKQAGRYDALDEQWPFAYDVKVQCPACEMRDFVADVLWHLNDTHKWTRERIADWVETIERRADADQARTQEHAQATAVSFAQK